MKGCCEWAEKDHNRDLEAVLDKRRVCMIRRADLQRQRRLDTLDESIQRLHELKDRLRALQRVKTAAAATGT